MNLSMSGEVFARFQSVNCTAIGAFTAASVTDIDENLGVVVPHGHASLRAGAEHATLAIQVRGEQLYSGYGFGSCWVCHDFRVLGIERLILRGLVVKKSQSLAQLLAFFQVFLQV